LDALAVHAVSARDLTLLGAAADRGLYRHASALWTIAITLGKPAHHHLRGFSPGDIPCAARWPSATSTIATRGGVAGLLRELREAGTGDAVRTLLARDPAGHVSLDNPAAVAWLLKALRAAGVSDAVPVPLPPGPPTTPASTTHW
jgi:hypothetical protein